MSETLKLLGLGFSVEKFFSELDLQTKFKKQNLIKLQERLSNCMLFFKFESLRKWPEGAKLKSDVGFKNVSENSIDC